MEPDRSRKISILEGSLATVHISVTSGALVTAYALMLGAGAFHLGLLSAVTALATVGAVAGAQVIGLFGRRKPVSVAASVSGRLTWAALCALPFLDLSDATRLTLFMLTVFLGNALVHLSGTAWLSWMTDLVPIEKRGRYFGVRNAVLGAVAMGTGYAVGRFFDAFIEADLRSEGFAWIFGIACVFAALAGLVLTRQWEPPMRGERTLPFVETLRRPWIDPAFRRFLTFVILWAIATGVASPFFGAHMIQNLGMSFSSIAIYSILAGSVNLISQPLWGRIIDRVGNRPVLACTLVGVFLLPLLWLFATPSFLMPIWIDAVLTGIFWPGFALAGFNLILATAPEENRSAYLGMHALALGVFTFLASLLGGVIGDALEGRRFAILGLDLIHYHMLFVLSSVLRILLLPLALNLREERAKTVAALLDLVGDKVSQRFYQGWQAGITIVRRMGK